MPHEGLIPHIHLYVSNFMIPVILLMLGNERLFCYWLRFSYDANNIRYDHQWWLTLPTLSRTVDIAKVKNLCGKVLTCFKLASSSPFTTFTGYYPILLMNDFSIDVCVNEMTMLLQEASGQWEDAFSIGQNYLSCSFEASIYCLLWKHCEHEYQKLQLSLEIGACCKFIYTRFVTDYFLMSAQREQGNLSSELSIWKSVMLV